MVLNGALWKGKGSWMIIIYQSSSEFCGNTKRKWKWYINAGLLINPCSLNTRLLFLMLVFGLQKLKCQNWVFLKKSKQQVINIFHFFDFSNLSVTSLKSLSVLCDRPRITSQAAFDVKYITVQSTHNSKSKFYCQKF